MNGSKESTSGEAAPLKSSITYGSSGEKQSARSSSKEDKRRSELPPEGHCHAGESDHNQAVTTLELFSDLAIVVAIHIVAEPLEEADANMLWYCIRVVMLVLLWKGGMMFMNAGVVFQRADCPFHYMTVFTWMFLVLHMMQALARDDHTTAAGIYLAGRCLEVLMFVKQVAEERPPDFFIPQERVNNLRSLVPFLMTILIVCEIIPLVIAMIFGHGQTLYLPAVLFFVSSTALAYILSAVISDARSTGKIMENTFATEHLHERYELITLIFIGEICFAASKSGRTFDFHRFAVTTATVAEAFGAYLLIFTTRHGAKSTEFWGRSAKHMVAGMLLFSGLFVAIPGLGSGFVRVMNPEQDADEKESETGNSPEQYLDDGMVCNGASAYLLCFSTAAFLILSAMINLLDWTPEQPEFQRIGIIGRVSTRCSFGLLILVWTISPFESMECIGTIPSATFLCPMAALLSAFLEVWAVGSLKWAPWTKWSLDYYYSTAQQDLRGEDYVWFDRILVFMRPLA
jgi:low temperature requirement protein LtrA